MSEIDVQGLKNVKRVCAIVLNYFGAEKTEKCLVSLLDQSLDTIYLVDNSASYKEQTALADVVERIKHCKAGFSINLILNEENLGFGRAINRVLTIAHQTGDRYDYYLLLNNDAEVKPGLLQGLLDKIIEDPQTALVSPRIISDNRETKYVWYHRLFGHLSWEPQPFSFPYLTGCCLLVDGNLVDEGRLFDEDFFMYGEDVWLTWHVTRQGRGIACTDKVSIVHEGTGSSRQGGLFYEYHVARGHVLLALKTARNPLEIPIMLAGRIAYLLARSLVRSTRYRTLVPLRAFVMAWFPLEIRAPERQAPLR